MTLMQLPRVKIQFLNGQIGTVGDSPDGLMALVVRLNIHQDSPLKYGTVYELYGMDDLTAMGVTAEDGGYLYKHVKEFYDEAEPGTKFVLYFVDMMDSLSDLCDKNNTNIHGLRHLIESTNGKLRGIGIVGTHISKYNPEIIYGPVGSFDEISVAGIEDEIYEALPNAQQLAEWSTTELYAPFFIVLEGRSYNPDGSLPDLTEERYNRCAIVIGDTDPTSKGAAVGTLLGRIASIPVQRNIGRVKDGSLFPLEMYVGSEKIESGSSTVNRIFEKGYIVPRKHVGRSGYFYADDPMACDPTDDYAHITSRRVIDKAYRIAYDTMLNELLDEIDLNEDGTMQHAVIKSWQQTLENAINRQMTANGELSATDGEGCQVYINEKQNVVSTSKIVLTLKVRPHGYARYIDVNLGFLVTTA